MSEDRDSARTDDLPPPDDVRLDNGDGDTRPMPALDGPQTRESCTYGTSPVKRQRRTKQALTELRDALYEIIESERPATVRQVFYRAVSAGLIPKSESEYKSICRLLAGMRRDGTLPFDWLADNTRWQRKPRTYDSLADMLRITSETYRRAMWNSQGRYVEIWLEKEALAGVLWQVTAQYDVPLMICKGYPSLSFLYSAAETIRDAEKPTYLYYFGDRDPSGEDIPRFVERELRHYAPDADITFERVAVTEAQIGEYDLQTRPTKTTDTRAKTFSGESVEVDAISPNDLRLLARRCIEQHIDWDTLERLERVEDAERKTLQSIALAHGA